MITCDMPLHADVAEFLGRLPTNRKSLEKMPLTEARDLMRLGRAGTSKEPIFSADVDCDGVPGRLYKPLDRVTSADKPIMETGKVGDFSGEDAAPARMGESESEMDSDDSGSDNSDSEPLGLCIFIHGGGH